MGTGTTTAAAAHAHHQDLDDHANDGLDRTVTIPRTRSKSRRSSPLTSLEHAWTAAGSSKQPTSWMLSRRTKRKILAGEDVDFDTILTEVTTNMATKGSVSGPQHRHIHDIGSWLQAWSSYMTAVLLADPARGYKLIGYQSIVAQASSQYQTSAWLKYDGAFRYFASRTTGVRWETINHHLWAQCFTGLTATSITCYTCGQPGHVATNCAHTNHSFRPPGKQRHLPITSPTPLQANPKSAISSMLVDARTKPHLACANTDMNVSSATAITQRPLVPARAPINKYRPDTPLQPEVFTMSLHTQSP